MLPPVKGLDFFFGVGRFDRALFLKGKLLVEQGGIVFCHVAEGWFSCPYAKLRNPSQKNKLSLSR